MSTITLRTSLNRPLTYSELDSNFSNLNDDKQEKNYTPTGASTPIAVESKLKQVISVKDFGAVGDFNDATMTGTDDTTAIQAAITAAASTSKRLYFPPGKYGISSPLVFADNDWEIVGAGQASTFLVAIDDEDMIQIDTSANTYRYGVIKDLTFRRNSATYSNTIAIRCKGTADVSCGVRHWTFQNLRFRGVAYGLYFENAGIPVGVGTDLTGGHGFNMFINLDVPLELSARYPTHVVRFIGPMGPHNLFSGGQYRSVTSSIRIGSGAADEMQGDLIITGIHFVLGDYAIEIYGPTNSGAYKSNHSITGNQFDVLNLGTVKADNINLFRIIGNNSKTAGGFGPVLTNVSEYVLENGNTWTFSSGQAKAFTVNHPVTIQQNLTHDGVRATFGGWVNLGSTETQTIASGAITATQTRTIVDTEASASTDDLDTINGGSDGDLLMIRSVSSARDVVCKDGTGNLTLNGDFTLSSVDDHLLLMKHGSNWAEISRSDNAT